MAKSTTALALALFVLSSCVFALSYASEFDSLTSNGWLILHQCSRTQQPAIRGDNLIGETSYNPVTAADDIKTNLKAVFTRSVDGELLAKWQLNVRNLWSDWYTFATPSSSLTLASNPEAITNVQHLITVFALMNNGQVYGIQQIGGAAPTSFSTWFQLPVVPSGAARDPTVVSAKDGRIFVYVMVNDTVYESKEGNAGKNNFGAWKAIGGSAIKGKFAVILNNWTGYLEGFAVLSNNKLYQAWQLKDESWHSFRSLWNGQPANPSDVAVHEMTGSIFHGMIELFLVDNSGQLWHIWQTTCDGIDNPWSQCTWGEYVRVGGKVPFNYPTVPISLAASNNVHGGVEVFITSSAGELYHIWQPQMWESWSDWETLGAPLSGALTSPPYLVHDTTGWWVAYVRGQNGDLEVNVQTRDIEVSPQVVSIPSGQTGALIVSWSVPKDEASYVDFLGIFNANQTDNSKYLDFLYVNGKQNPSGYGVTNGNVKFSLALTPGMYEVRYLVNGQPNPVMSALFKVDTNGAPLNPVEQFFMGMTIGLGTQAFNFATCVADWQTTFATFNQSFYNFEHLNIIQGLNLFGQGLQDFSTALTDCGDTRIAQALKGFIGDLIACVSAAECFNFVIDEVDQTLIVAYLRTHEIFGDIKGASNDWNAKQFEESGLNSGRVIAAIIAPIRDSLEFAVVPKRATLPRKLALTR